MEDVGLIPVPPEEATANNEYCLPPFQRTLAAALAAAASDCTQCVPVLVGLVRANAVVLSLLTLPIASKLNLACALVKVQTWSRFRQEQNGTKVYLFEGNKENLF